MELLVLEVFNAGLERCRQARVILESGRLMKPTIIRDQGQAIIAGGAAWYWLAWRTRRAG